MTNQILEVIMPIPSDAETILVTGEIGYQARFDAMRIVAEDAHPGFKYCGTRIGWENECVLPNKKYKISLKKTE